MSEMKMSVERQDSTDREIEGLIQTMLSDIKAGKEINKEPVPDETTQPAEYKDYEYRVRKFSRMDPYNAISKAVGELTVTQWPRLALKISDIKDPYLSANLVGFNFLTPRVRQSCVDAVVELGDVDLALGTYGSGRGYFTPEQKIALEAIINAAPEEKEWHKMVLAKLRSGELER